MFAYVFRRMLYMPLILLGVIFITFVLFEMTSTPEAQARTQIGEKASARQVYDWLESRGLINWTESGEAKIKAIADGKLNPKQAQFVSKKSTIDIPADIEEIADKTSDLQEDITELLEDNEIPESAWADADVSKQSELAKYLELEGKPSVALKKARKNNSTIPVFQDLASLEAQIEHLQEVAKKRDEKNKEEIERFNDLRAKQGKLRNALIKLQIKRDEAISGARNEFITLKLGLESAADKESPAYVAAKKESVAKFSSMSGHRAGLHIHQLPHQV